MGPSVFLGFGSDRSWCWAWILNARWQLNTNASEATTVRKEP